MVGRSTGWLSRTCSCHSLHGAVARAARRRAASWIQCESGRHGDVPIRIVHRHRCEVWISRYTVKSRSSPLAVIVIFDDFAVYHAGILLRLYCPVHLFNDDNLCRGVADCRLDGRQASGGA